jgi:signal transduction histidine kinase
VGSQHRHTEALLGHQAKLARAELGRARALVAEQRLRIARDLHDVVAHSITVITVQAAFGRLVADDDPDQAGAALATIEGTGRQTLVEMRQLLQVLRDADRDGAAEVALELAPTPGLADLDQLVSRTAATGVQLNIDIVGVPRPLPAGVDTSAYRVIQEAVTNVVKHAGVATASAVVRYEQASLEIQVSDAGRGCDHPVEPGYGLVGMRERLQLYGGAFAAGPLPGHGFRVSGCFPLERPGGSGVGSPAR